MTLDSSVVIKIRLSAERVVHLDRMAAEAGVKRATLAKSLLESLIDDDAKAHGKEKQPEAT